MTKRLYNYFSPISATHVETTDLARAKRNVDIGNGIMVWSQSKKGGTYNNQVGRLKFNIKTKKWKMKRYN